MPTARLIRVTMSRRDMLPSGIRIDIAQIGEQTFNVAIATKPELFEEVKTLTSGNMNRLPDRKANGYTYVGFSVSGTNYEALIQEVRDLYGTYFCLEEPMHTYEVKVPAEERADNSYYPHVLICDLVPGNHRYIRVSVPKGYANNLAKAINNAVSIGQLPALTRKAVVDTGNRVINLTFVSGDNHLENFRKIAELLVP